MSRPIRLPDRFYLPRTDALGREVRDVMPWEGATSYATDGERLGVQYGDGHVAWLGNGPLAEAAGQSLPAADSLREDFEGVDVDALLRGLRSYMDLHPILKTVWREDMENLERIRLRNGGPT
ncbi:MAG TPA: hypothetical protein VFQ39_08405 [Longimicrobium sp.]|nr:hypothetical protein [Longimicrobium sp.]